MHFDVLFLDTTANKYYDRMVLEKHPLGGSEASVVRVAEGLASLGLKVAVVQSRIPFFEPTMGQHCFFLHADSLPDVSCNHYIQIRRNHNAHLFPKAKKYLWLHDVATPEEAEKQASSIAENKISIIGVSQWHSENIKSVLPNHLDISYIYNPVPDELYTEYDRARPYDYNLLVWMSSPHKGLGKALELFKKIRARNDKMQFIIFNPGYLPIDTMKIATQPGVSVYGPMSCKQVWGILKKALCIFYPTEWDETFGCIAAEANALGVPIATFKRAGLAESVSSEDQYATNDDEIVEKVLEWSKKGSPSVKGEDGFKFSTVILQWIQLLAR